MCPKVTQGELALETILLLAFQADLTRASLHRGKQEGQGHRGSRAAGVMLHLKVMLGQCRLSVLAEGAVPRKVGGELTENSH